MATAAVETVLTSIRKQPTSAFRRQCDIIQAKAELISAALKSLDSVDSDFTELIACLQEHLSVLLLCYSPPSAADRLLASENVFDFSASLVKLSAALQAAKINIPEFGVSIDEDVAVSDLNELHHYCLMNLDFVPTRWPVVSFIRDRLFRTPAARVSYNSRVASLYTADSVPDELSLRCSADYAISAEHIDTVSAKLRSIFADVAHKDNDIVLARACATVAGFACSESSRTALVDIGIVPQICSALASHLQNPTLVREACQALATICLSTTAAQEAVTANLPETLRLVLESHSRDIAVLGAVCDTVATFASAIEGNKESFTVIVAPLSGVLKAHTTNCVMQTNCAHALWRLAARSAPNQEACAGVGACAALVAAIKAHAGVKLPRMAAAALAVMCSTAACRKQVLKADGITVLVRCMQTLDNDALVQESCVTTLRYLALNAEVGMKQLALGADEAICLAIQHHRSPPSLRTQCCAAIMNICADEGIAAEMADSPAILKTIASIITDVTGNTAETLGFCFGALGRLVTDAKDDLVMKEKLYFNIQHALSALEAHSTNLVLAQEAITFLVCLCLQNEAGLAVFASEASSLQVVVSCMCIHTQDARVLRAGCALINSYDQRYTVRRKISANAGLASCFAAAFPAHSEDKRLSMDLLKLVQSIVADTPENAEALGVAGAVPMIIAGMDTHDVDPQYQQMSIKTLRLLCIANEDNRLALAQHGGLRRAAQILLKHSKNLTLQLTVVELMKAYSVFLTKRGGVIKSWQKRWCVLDDKQLLYYKTPEDIAPQSKISYSDIRAVRESTAFELPFLFEVETAERTFFFSASNAKERQQTMAALESLAP
eukprot:TRINITY_DN895_c0_g1_i1.p1 TRINITY_DN895_c0_g1~~TRINITY_DN895_c0_g1_i1.p1  ORF type:complete len:857 (-),score=196.23 TRINITY_DN895_c0_g1_i1:51-2567(-)